MNPSVIFAPFFGTMILTIVVWIYMYSRRLPFIFFTNGIDPKRITPLELAQRSPPAVSNPSGRT